MEADTSGIIDTPNLFISDYPQDVAFVVILVETLYDTYPNYYEAIGH